MSDSQTLTANFCPACGTALESAEATVADAPFANGAQRTFKSGGGHVVIDGAQVRVFVHKEAEQ